MTTRTKTITYSSPMTTTVSTNNVTLNLTQFTIYIPETVVAFRNVILEVHGQDVITATGGSFTHAVGIQLGSAGYSTTTNANTLTNSGENLNLYACHDVTSYFTTNYSGTSKTCDVQVLTNQSTGTTLGFINIWAKVTITYAYDDTSATQVKTVRIPLPSPTGTVATTGTTLTSAFPALDTWLPEASKTYRCIALEVSANEGDQSSTTDFTLSASVGGVSRSAGATERALQTSKFSRWRFGYLTGTTPDWTSSSTATVSLTSASQASCNHACAMMEVTYEFTVSTTTTVMNSLVLLGDYDKGHLVGSSSDFMRASLTFNIPEPATITFYPQQSAMRMYMHDTGSISGFNLRTGSESSFTAHTSNLGVVGGSSVAQRVFPSGDTLARGSNTLKADMYGTSSVNPGAGVTTLFILNYTSGVHTIGGTKTPGAHSQTTQWRLGGNSTEATGNSLYTSSTAPTFSEDYYFTQVAVMGYVYIDFASGGGYNWGDIILAEITTGESGGSASLWQDILTPSIYTDAECGLVRQGSPVPDFFRMWAGDARPNRLDIETSRVWRARIEMPQTNGWHWLRLLTTHHDIEYTIAGTVSGYTGDGSGITVGIHDATTGELLKTATTAAGGGYSTVWWNNLNTIYTEARQDDTHTGRSAHGSAV